MERFKLRRNLYNGNVLKKWRLIKIFLIIISVFVIIQIMTDKVETTLLTLCEAKVESIGITISNKAIDDIMEDISYEDLVNFLRDENGKIIALKSNVVEMNGIASQIAARIQEMYDDMEDIYVYVPLRKLYW